MYPISESSTDPLVAIDSLIRSFSTPLNMDKLSSSKRKSISSYSIGDVVRITPLRKINTVVRLARIRAINIEHDSLLKLLDTDGGDNDDEKKQNIEYIGVEYFNWKVNTNNTDLIQDGTINGIKIFNVKKPGYGAFIKTRNIMGTLWTKSKSKKALKLKTFDYETFIKAAKYGSMPVIKHMLQMNDCIKHPALIINGKDRKTKGRILSPICQAIFCNHYEIVELLLQKYGNYNNNNNNKEYKCEYEYDYTENNNNNEYILPKLRIFKPRKNTDILESKDKRTKFYNPLLFDKLCKNGNIKMLSLLLKSDSWPIYYKRSYGLYLTTTIGNLELIKLLLLYLNNPHYINLALYFDGKQRTIIPQTNLNLLNVAISHHRLEIIRYLITEWKYKHIIIKNQCIYLPTQPHILPTLLFTILDCHLHFENRINFTCDCIELLTKYCDPIDIGLNWICNKPLSKQKNIILGDISNNTCVNQNILYINRTLCVGTLLAALVYKCKALWVAFRSYDNDKKELKIGIQKLIQILVQNGIDWNIGKYNPLNVKNIIMKYTTYPYYKITDLEKNICDDQDFVHFFRQTVSKSIHVFRKIWLDAFLKFYKEDKLMANIFKWYVLDFVVPRHDILNGLKYFTLKPMEKQEENEKKDENDDNDYIDWEGDDDNDNNQNDEKNNND